MRLNVLFREEQPFQVGLSESDQTFGASFGSIQTVTENNYEHLINKPTINSVELSGALTARDLGLGNVYYDTTANWNAQLRLIAEEAAIYIYSDYQIYEDEAGNQTAIAGLKIGDGTSYLIDMPFVTDNMSGALIRHLADNVVHITAEERAFWNNKVSAYMDHESTELLVLSKHTYEDENGDIQTI